MRETRKRGRLTPEERIAYVEGDGQHCPYCGDGDISGGPFECESATVWQDVTCRVCHRTWQDLYHLVDVDDEFTYEEDPE
jgi:hypothetical protein